MWDVSVPSPSFLGETSPWARGNRTEVGGILVPGNQDVNLTVGRCSCERDELAT